MFRVEVVVCNDKRLTIRFQELIYAKEVRGRNMERALAEAIVWARRI